jgi:MscS family membrane protein
VWEQLQTATGGQVTAPAGRIELARAEGEQSVWRFTDQTVADAPRLYESMRALPPRYTAPQDQSAGELFELLGPTFQRTPLWGWGALLGAIFAGLLAGKIVQATLRRVGDDLLRRGWDIRARALHNTASPASLALLSGGLMVGLWFVVKTEDVNAFAGKIISFLFIVSAGWLLYNLVDVIDVALRRVTGKTDNRLDDMVVPLIRKTLRIFLVVIFTFVVAENIFGLDLTAWLAGLGIAGLAVSLSAQDSIKNLFGSLTVFFDKPFVIGDFISFDGVTGIVEAIGFRSTRIRLLSGHLVTVPNMKFIDNRVENISARPYIRREMNVTITYDTLPEKIDEAVRIVREILHAEDVVSEGRFDMEKHPPRIAFNELNADSLNIKAFYWYQLAGDRDRGFFTFMSHSELVNTKLFRAFGEAGIDFAFPTQTLYLAGDPDRQLAVKVVGDDRAGQ